MSERYSSLCSDHNHFLKALTIIRVNFLRSISSSREIQSVSFSSNFQDWDFINDKFTGIKVNQNCCGLT